MQPPVVCTLVNSLIIGFIQKCSIWCHKIFIIYCLQICNLCIYFKWMFKGVACSKCSALKCKFKSREQVHICTWQSGIRCEMVLRRIVMDAVLCILFGSISVEVIGEELHCKKQKYVEEIYNGASVSGFVFHCDKHGLACV